MSSKNFDIHSILAASDTWSDANESVSCFLTCLSLACSPPAQAILEPFRHVYSVPGKDIRGQMLDAFDTWLQVPQEKLKIISKVVSMLHTASLLYESSYHCSRVLWAHVAIG